MRKNNFLNQYIRADAMPDRPETKEERLRRKRKEKIKKVFTEKEIKKIKKKRVTNNGYIYISIDGIPAYF